MTTELEELEELEEEEIHYLATLEHDHLASNIHNELRNFLKGKDLGRAFGGTAEYRFISEEPTVGRKPGKQPDVSFISKAKLPARLRSYPDIVPDLVVEVSSPTDREYLIEAKVALYQKYGVKLVWVVHPYSRRVDVYRLANGLQPESVPERGILSGEDIIPNWQLPVVEIFDYPPDPDPIPDKPKRSKP